MALGIRIRVKGILGRSVLISKCLNKKKTELLINYQKSVFYLGFIFDKLFEVKVLLHILLIHTVLILIHSDAQFHFMCSVDVHSFIPHGP
jgi:hypothetical protein